MISHRRMSLLCATACASLFASIVLLQAAAFAALPGVSTDDAKNIMPVSQIKRGMRGYGLTVFHGTTIEKFDVLVLGVLKQMNTGKDLILVRVGGGPITSRQTGILAGMSGSPCYIDGRLVGAIAYGSEFTKEPIGMITPIADMLEAWDSHLPKTASGYSSPQALDQPMTINGKSVRSIAIDRTGQHDGIENSTLHMRPLLTPLMVSGLSARGIGRLAEVLQPFGLEPVQGPGGGKADVKVNPSLVPGAAFGMSLATGDIDMTAVGTLTYRRGNRILGMGHPVLGIGALDAPLTTAYVADVLSSYRVSTKMASPIKTVGRIFQDRPWSVAGNLGTLPKTIPATISVDDQAFGRSKVYHVSVMNHPLLASKILTTVVGEAVYQTHPTPGDATAEVSYDVTADQVGKISRSNMFFDPASIDSSSIQDLGTLLQMLSANRFYPLDIKSVNVRVRIVDKRDTATIDRIFVKKTEYEPGETVDVGVVLRPYKKDRVTKTFSVKLPATAGDGKVTLQVRGGATPTIMPISLVAAASGDDPDGAMLSGSGSDLSNADNVKQLIDKYLEREKNNEVVVKLMLRSTAINVTGQKLSGLPNSIADVMKSSRNSGLRMERDEVKKSFDAGTIVYGSATLSINVKRKDLKEGTQPTRPVSSAVSTSDSSDDESTSMSSGYDMEPMSTGTIPAIKLEAANDDSADTAEDSLSSLDESTEEPVTVTKDTAKPDEAKKPAEPAAAATPKSDVKTVVRQLSTWLQRTKADFAKGTFSGVSASSDNKLELVPTVKKLVETPEQFVWSIAPGNGGVYAGTGNSGKIYSITSEGKITPFYETGELEVQSLARDKEGNLYAGTSPNGRIFKIAPDGKGKLLYQTKEKYVLALALDDSGNLYAGVGDAGKVYRIKPDGSAAVFTELNEQQVLSLYWAGDSLLAGTGTNGVLYRIDKVGRATPLFDGNEESITAVTADTKGNVYAGTSPKGAVYRISPDGRYKTILPKAESVLSLVSDSKDNVYAVSDGSLVELTPDGTVIQLDSSDEKVQFLSLALDEKNGELFASTGNIGAVYSSKCCDISGSFESTVHDAKMISRWGRVKWLAETPEGTGVEVRTRTGNVSTPDETWSNWSAPYTESRGQQMTDPAGRYVQYQVTLKTSKVDVTPKLSSLSISYLTPNQAPEVSVSAPTGGTVWAGKETIRWTGSDPDKDSLTYDVFYSSDGGKNWKSLVGGVSGSNNGGNAKATAPEIIGKVKTELDKSKDVPEDMKQQLLKGPLGTPPSAPPGAASASAATAASESSSKTTYTWDTTAVPDGTYMIKVQASDKTSNATGALTDDAVSDPFVVSNKPPTITLVRKNVQLKAAGPAEITGTAQSTLVEVVGIQFRVDGGVWQAAQVADGMFDSTQEQFTVVTDPLKSGSHKLEIQAVDAAGNASSETVEVKVS